MSESATFFNQPMNITESVPADTNFYCTNCVWVGLVADLAFIDEFSCCPECYEYDVRVKNKVSDI